MKKRISEEELKELQTEEKKEKEDRSTEKKSVTVYIIILFAAVLALIIVSYFIQQRNNQNTIRKLTTSHSQFSTQAMENIEKLQNENLEYAVQVQQLQDETDRLQEALGTLTEENENLHEKNQTAMDLNKEWQLKYDTMCALLDMKNAVEKKDMETAIAKQRIIESAISYLDAEYVELFNDLVDTIQK